MGVLPLGTGNAFARDLGIPTDVEEAVEIIAEGRTADVDLGVCNGRYFLNTVTIGLTSKVAKSLTVPLKRRFGRFVYAGAIVNAVRTAKPFHVRIETEHGVTSLEAIQLVLGNGRYHAGPLPISPGAAITSGSLHLYAVKAGSTADLLKYALMLPTGFQAVLKTVHGEDTKAGSISATPRQSVVIDGEVAERTPLTFSVAPEILRVFVPQSFEG
jgi:YegS/Rv2252/BmrU family lipid kinase